VHLQFDDQRVCLEIADDGMGYDPAVARESGGMGLGGMEERARRINGRLEIVSAPGKGTTVKVEVPS
jgi:signal transduction histidine kinase